MTGIDSTWGKGASVPEGSSGRWDNYHKEWANVKMIKKRPKLSNCIRSSDFVNQ